MSKLFSVMSLTVLSRRAFGALVVALLLPPCLSFADDEIAAELSLPVNRLFGGARLPDPAEEEAAAFQHWINRGIRPPQLLEQGIERHISIEQANELLEKIIFGTATADAEDASSRLETMLNVSIEQVDRFCGLNRSQIGKLQLAGRGDIHRFLPPFIQRLETLRTRLPEVIERGASMEFARETRDLHKLVRNAAFLKNSLYARFLSRMLTTEQAAEYARQRARAKPRIRELLPELIAVR